MSFLRCCIAAAKPSAETSINRLLVQDEGKSISCALKEDAIFYKSSTCDCVVALSKQMAGSLPDTTSLKKLYLEPVKRHLHWDHNSRFWWAAAER